MLLFTDTRSHCQFGNRVSSSVRATATSSASRTAGAARARTPASFDCSGLVRFVYSHFGIGLPHSSWADLAHGQRVTRRSLRPGDLVFFYDASHVGIYAGYGRFIDARRTPGARVRVSAMRQYSYYGARRFR